MSPIPILSRRAFLISATGAAVVGFLVLRGASAAIGASRYTADQIARAQQRLNDQSYWCGPVTGEFNDLTTCAVLAYQKANGWAPDGILDFYVMESLTKPRIPARFTTVGRVVEVDLTRQLLRVVSNGEVLLSLHVSTGSGGESNFGDRVVLDRTPRGKFRIRRSASGIVTNSLGSQYAPQYFMTPYGIYGRSGMAQVRGATTTGGVAVAVEALDRLVSAGDLKAGRVVLLV